MFLSGVLTSLSIEYSGGFAASRWAREEHYAVGHPYDLVHQFIFMFGESKLVPEIESGPVQHLYNYLLAEYRRQRGYTEVVRPAFYFELSSCRPAAAFFGYVHSRHDLYPGGNCGVEVLGYPVAFEQHAVHPCTGHVIFKWFEMYVAGARCDRLVYYRIGEPDRRSRLYVVGELQFLPLCFAAADVYSLLSSSMAKSVACLL